MTHIRAFIALSLPIDVVKRAVEVQDKLVESAVEARLNVKWVPGPNMHLTLKFLGEIPRESVHAIEQTLRENLAGQPPLSIQLAGLGAFPSADRPRVLWLGVSSGGEAVAALAAGVDGWLDALGFPKEKREFHPHLTLGRVKQGKGDIIGDLEVDLGECTTREVVVYESILQRKGAEYKPLVRIPLVSAPA